MHYFSLWCMVWFPRAYTKCVRFELNSANMPDLKVSLLPLSVKCIIAIVKPTTQD